MIRLSGKSVLYLPHDYTPGSLVLPTCIRATAQYLARHTTTRGVFRIPGSVRVVNALFNYYCYMENGAADVASTVRCANLPVHIQASVHDVASTLKRFLSVLPGGILGTLSIFDALVAIHSNLRGDLEFPRTRQTKDDAKLIALAIGTMESQFRRELICAVFGLLSLIGRAAEVAPQEDKNGRPLPTSDLMGYGALGIVFGPLLMGDLLDQYDMNIAKPDSGLLLFPPTPSKLQKGPKNRGKPATTERPSHMPPAVDKIHIANSVTKMLIANWRDIIRQMKSLGTHHHKFTSSLLSHTVPLRSSMSETFIMNKAQDWDQRTGESGAQVNRNSSPGPETPTMGARRRRPQSKQTSSSNRLSGKPSGTVLSPTVEEGVTENPGDSHQEEAFSGSETERRLVRRVDVIREENTVYRSPEVSMDDVPPRTSSIQHLPGMVLNATHRRGSQVSQGTQVTYHSEHKAVEASLSTRGGVINNGEFEAMAALPKEPVEDQIIKSMGGSQTQQHATLYHSPRSNFVRRISSPQFSGSALTYPVDNIWEQQSYEGPGNETRISEQDYPSERGRLSEYGNLHSMSTCAYTEASGLPSERLDQVGVGTESTSERSDAPQSVRQSNATREQRARDGSPARATEPELGSRRVGVKAMAAMFEGQDEPMGSTTPLLKLGSRGWNLTEQSTLSSPRRDTRTPKSGSFCQEHSPQIATRWHRRSTTSSKSTSTDSNRREISAESASRTSAGDSVSWPAAAAIDTEKRHWSPSAKSSLLAEPTETIFSPETMDAATSNEIQNQKQGVLNPETMVPPQDQPPVAHHLNLARLPSSTASTDDAPAQVISVPTSRPGRTTSLHTQIRNLQRQLDSKTGEVVQLRRQLEAQENSDVGTLSEQLRQAKREVQMWREQAGAAERRVEVFERSTARLKGSRDAEAVAALQGGPPKENLASDIDSQESYDSDLGVYLRRHATNG